MKEIRNEIVELLREAEVNLKLYNTGQDNYAITRYELIMNEVKSLRIKLKEQLKNG